MQGPKLMKLPFALSWWALSFPLAALSVASFVYGREAESAAHVGIGLVVLALLVVVVAGAALAHRAGDRAGRDLPAGVRARKTVAQGIRRAT